MCDYVSLILINNIVSSGCVAHMVECSLRKGKVVGSMPATSIFGFLFLRSGIGSIIKYMLLVMKGRKVGSCCITKEGVFQRDNCFYFFIRNVFTI